MSRKRKNINRRQALYLAASKPANRKKTKHKSSKAAWEKLEYSAPTFIGKIPEKRKKLSYKEKLEDPRWKSKRHKIFKRDHFSCQKCDSRLKLQVHHKKYIWDKEPWNYPDEDLTTLCEVCHSKEHNVTKKEKNKGLYQYHAPA